MTMIDHRFQFTWFWEQVNDTSIKTTTSRRVGKPGQPVAEKTLLGWTLMPPGREGTGFPILLTQSAPTDYEELCDLDALGLADTHENDQLVIYEEFKEAGEKPTRLV